MGNRCSPQGDSKHHDNGDYTTVRFKKKKRFVGIFLEYKPLSSPEFLLNNRRKKKQYVLEEELSVPQSFDENYILIGLDLQFGELDQDHDFFAHKFDSGALENQELVPFERATGIASLSQDRTYEHLILPKQIFCQFPAFEYTRSEGFLDAYPESYANCCGKLPSEGFVNALKVEVAGGASAGENRIQAVCFEENSCGICYGFNGRVAAVFLGRTTLYDTILRHTNSLEWERKTNLVSDSRQYIGLGDKVTGNDCHLKLDIMKSDSFIHRVIESLQHAFRQADSDFLYMEDRPDLLGSCVLISWGDCRVLLGTYDEGNHDVKGYERLKAVQRADCSSVVDNEQERTRLLISEHPDDPAATIPRGKLKVTTAFGVGNLKKDSDKNLTRYVVLARNPMIPGTDGHFKTCIVFALQQGPAMLMKASLATEPAMNAMKHSKERTRLVISEHPDDPARIARAKVNGKLKATLAFGVDYLKKKTPNDAPNRILCVPNLISPPYISPQPSINVHRISNPGHLVIYGSDGLFDFLSNVEEVINLVRSYISINPSGDPAKFVLQRQLVERATDCAAGFSLEESRNILACWRRKYPESAAVTKVPLHFSNHNAYPSVVACSSVHVSEKSAFELIATMMKYMSLISVDKIVEFLGNVAKYSLKRSRTGPLELKHTQSKMQILEMKSMWREDCKNIVKLQRSYENNKNVRLLMDLSEGGALYIKTGARGHYRERTTTIIVKHVLTNITRAPLSNYHPRIGDKFLLGRELGRGRFSITYLCTNRETGEVLACKSISKCNVRDLEDVRMEVTIISMLPEHKNVVKLKALYEDSEKVYLVMELCEGGELFDRIVAKGYYSERDAANVTRAILEIVKTCHDNGVIHRDLKPENLLFVNNEDNSTLKVIDFGLSTTFKPGDKFTKIVGSSFYMAPEVLTKNYGPEIDVWSAGVIIYILLCGVPPFWAETNHGIALAILKGVIDFRREPWPRISESAKNLVRQMLEQDPKKRLTAQQVLDHPWMQNATNQSRPSVNDPLLSPKSIHVGKAIMSRAHPHLQPSINDKYAIGRELGRGQFGVTYLCINRDTNEVLACKSISKRNVMLKEYVQREVTIMSMLPKHENIVQLKGIYEDNEDVHMVMELCEGGELYDRIIARGYYTEIAAVNIVRAIAEVIKACHENGVMHRDLKPENLLFVNKEENSVLKVIDFGLSMTFKPGEKFTEIVGTKFYMAPEVLRKYYGQEVDIWSAGVILYILLCGVPPFWAETDHGIAFAILRGVTNFDGEPWPHISKNTICLVQQMLEPNPKKRLTAQQILDHPWVQNAKKAKAVLHLMNRFKKKAFQIIRKHLSAQEMDLIIYMLTLMGIGYNGKITYKELRGGLQKLGTQLSEHKIKRLLDEVDFDGDGGLDDLEFMALAIHLLKMENDAHFCRAFMYFDTDGSGFIEFKELREALIDESGEIDNSVLVDLMLEVDADKDGRINYKEFVSVMRVGTKW